MQYRTQVWAVSETTRSAGKAPATDPQGDGAVTPKQGMPRRRDRRSGGGMVTELMPLANRIAYSDAEKQKVLGLSKLAAGATTALAGGNAQTGINTAETAVQNNALVPVLIGLAVALERVDCLPSGPRHCSGSRWHQDRGTTGRGESR